LLIMMNKPEKQATLDAWVAAGGVIAPFVPPVSVQKRDIAAEINALKSALLSKGVICHRRYESKGIVRGEAPNAESHLLP
jgi:hypothetical protein